MSASSTSLSGVSQIHVFTVFNSLANAFLSELEALRPQVEAELLRMKEVRTRREEESAYRQRQKDVEGLYKSFKVAKEMSPLPSLYDFRKLPMVQRIQYKPADKPSTALWQELRNSKLMVEFVKEDLSKARTSAKNALGAVLGFQSWKSPSSTKLHPVDRLTARFRCKKCDKNGQSSNWDDAGFDFVGAFQHHCRRKGGPLAKEPWKADGFVPDERVCYMEVPRRYVLHY